MGFLKSQALPSHWRLNRLSYKFIWGGLYAVQAPQSALPPHCYNSNDRIRSLISQDY